MKFRMIGWWTFSGSTIAELSVINGMNLPAMRWLLFIFCLLLLPLAAWAHHPSGTEPVGNDVVMARVYTQDRERLLQLGNDYDLWYYLWREGYALIRSDRDRLPADAQVDVAMSESLKQTAQVFRGTGTIPARTCYRTVEKTYADLQQLATDQPGLAQWVDYGDSWEKDQVLGGYDLSALILSNQSIAGPKPVLMVMAAMHARELSTAEVATRFAELLFNGYGTDPDITWMLDYFEVHILPQQNPDGRKMAEGECTVSCFPGWRKNTNQNYCGPASSSRGADLNRNSDSSFWGGASSSGSACNDTYRGPSPSSEPETLAVETYAASVFPDFRDALPNDLTTPADEESDGVFISIHSAGDIVFYPWEGVNDLPPNLAGLRGLAQKMGHATTFAACQNCFIGTASGTTVDNVYEKLGIASYTYEIGSSFGESCTGFESTVLPRTLDGLLSAARHSRRPYQTSLGPDVLDVELTSVGGGNLNLLATADDTRRAVNGGGEPLDASQAIAAVRYSIGEPPWLASSVFDMSADDGTFDEASEVALATINKADVGTGKKLIYVFAEDADGNQGPPSAVWADLDLMFDHSFESQP